MRTLVLVFCSSHARYMALRLPPSTDTFFTFCHVRPISFSIRCSSGLAPSMYTRSPAEGVKLPSGMMYSP